MKLCTYNRSCRRRVSNQAHRSEPAHKEFALECVVSTSSSRASRLRAIRPPLRMIDMASSSTLRVIQCQRALSRTQPALQALPRENFLLTPLDRSRNIRKFRCEPAVKQRKLLMKPIKKQMLAIACPTCSASPGRTCELTNRQPRRELHRDRRLASDRHLPDTSAARTNSGTSRPPTMPLQCLHNRAMPASIANRIRRR
jgi:hypothetical protein